MHTIRINVDGESGDGACLWNDFCVLGDLGHDPEICDVPSHSCNEQMYWNQHFENNTQLQTERLNSIIAHACCTESKHLLGVDLLGKNRVPSSLWGSYTYACTTF